MSLCDHLRGEALTRLRLRPLVTVYAHTAVAHAAALMREQSVGACIVVDTNVQPVGVFNEKCLIHALATTAHAMVQPVGEFMLRGIPCIRQDAPIAQLIGLLKSRQVRSACVVDEEGRAVAMTGVRGLMEYLADYFARQVKVQPLNSRLSSGEREGA